MLVGMVVAPDDRELLHVEARLLQFLDGCLSGNVSGIDGYNGIFHKGSVYLCDCLFAGEGG